MDRRTFGRVTVTVPNLNGLSNVSSLEGGRLGIVEGFRYGDVDLRVLNLADLRLLTGRITGVHASRAQLSEMRLESVEFDNSDLGSASWHESSLSRVVFRNCKLMGATLSALTLDNVLFEDCRLDYTTFDGIRATGPVVFSKCSLNEAVFTNCDLSKVVLDACTLEFTEFGHGKYQGLDLRSNDLSALRGVPHLAKVIIDRAQQIELAHALMADLDVTCGDTLD